VYFPWNVGATFWEVLAADHGRLIANAVRWAFVGRSAVEVSGASVLDIAVRRGSDELAVALVNLTNPMMMKGPIRETYPVGRHVVSVAIPAGRSFAAAKLLVAGTPAKASAADGRVEIEVPGIDLIEVLHVSWA
jgi:hypothetical protein